MKCKKCGACCYFGVYDPMTKKAFKTNLRCPLLTQDNLCSVYDNRPDWCMSANTMKRLGLLLPNCGYKEE